MLKLTKEELVNVQGGASVYIAPTYDLFMKIYKFTYKFIKSLLR